MKNLSINVDLVSIFKKVNVPEEYEVEFHKEIISVNKVSENIIAIILIIVELVLLGIDVFTHDLWPYDMNIFGHYTNIHLLLLLVPIIFLLLKYIGKKSI